jgi:hypothetical protein
MKNLERKSVEELEILKKECEEKIRDYEEMLKITNSQLYTLYVRMWINHYKVKITKIEEELNHR